MMLNLEDGLADLVDLKCSDIEKGLENAFNVVGFQLHDLLVILVVVGEVANVEILHGGDEFFTQYSAIHLPEYVLDVLKGFNNAIVVVLQPILKTTKLFLELKELPFGCRGCLLMAPSAAENRGQT